MYLLEPSIDYKLLNITCPAFKNGDLIPQRYTCDGLNVNPPLEISGINDNAKCLAIILNDPDAPIGVWVHWLVWNIPVTNKIFENQINGIEGLNDFQLHHYNGPCPHSGTHRYIFKVFALDTKLNLSIYTRQFQLEREMSNHIIGYGELMGFYKRK